MPSATSLAHLTVGASAKIASCPAEGPAFLRLREMGLLPGTALTLVRAALMVALCSGRRISGSPCLVSFRRPL